MRESGWQPQPEQTEVYAASIPARYRQQLASLPHDPDKSVYPFRALARQLAGSRHVKDGRLLSLDQGSYGSCTGFAGSRAADITAACDIEQRQQAEAWPLDESGRPVIVSPDYVYGASREVSDRLGRSQGSYGGAVAKALREYGAIHQLDYGRHDLARYSIPRCRRWAARGIPDPVRDAARLHPFLTTVRIETVQQACALTQHGYGFFICCNLAWSDKRDADGFARRVRPGWSHAQAAGLGYVALKHGRRVRRGFLVQNSWGPWNRGGTGELTDMPEGAYFIGWHEMAIALQSRDCYALGDYQGFPSRYNLEEIGW